MEMKTIGQRISELRKAKGLTKSELSRLVGMSHVQIGKYESDQSEPTSGVLKKLSESLETTTDYLIKGLEPIHPDLFTQHQLEQYLKKVKDLPLSEQKQVHHFLELIFLKMEARKIGAFITQSA
jgi:transcriptional regulator with XRE-family HTH domain